jgi:hypothetical protein
MLPPKRLRLYHAWRYTDETRTIIELGAQRCVFNAEFEKRVLKHKCIALLKKNM